MIISRRSIVDVLTSPAFGVALIVYVLYLPLPVALGFQFSKKGVLAALIYAAIAWWIVRGRHWVIGGIFFSMLVFGVLSMVALAIEFRTF
jgi:hypothetical protein